MATVVCTSCREVLKVGEEQKLHYKSDRHAYNVKRKLENLAPIPADVWEKKLARFAEIRMEKSKGDGHLKKDKQRKKRKDTDDTRSVTTNTTVGGKSWVHVSEVNNGGSNSSGILAAGSSELLAAANSDNNVTNTGSSSDDNTTTIQDTPAEVHAVPRGPFGGAPPPLTTGDSAESVVPALETSSSSSSSFVKLPSNDDIAFTESPLSLSRTAGSQSTTDNKGGLLTKAMLETQGKLEGENQKLLGGLNAINRKQSPPRNAKKRSGSVSSEASIPEERESKALPENPHLHSLFDKQCFETTEENLAYMEKKFSFFLPDSAYCVKPNELLGFLHDKITNGWTCIQCDREFKSEADCRRHMFSKNHTTIGTEGYTNSGKYSEDRTNDLMAQLDAFYDYSTSYKELNIKDVAKRTAGDQLAMIAEGPSEIDPKTVKTDDERLEVLLSFFDEDQDSKWKFSEAQEFYRFYTDEAEELSFAEYSSFVKECGRGTWDLEALKKFYKVSKKDDKKLLKEHFERFLEEWWDDDVDEEFEMLKTPANEASSSSSSSGSNNTTGSSDSPAGEKKQLKSTRMLRRPIVHEVDDEAEFERLAQAYGLKKATILPNGNLQLPDGSTAVHRDVHFVYKQRGDRADPADLRRRKQAQKALSNPILKAMGQQGNKELLNYMVENNCKSAKEAFAHSEIKAKASQKRLEDDKNKPAEGGVVALSNRTRVAYGLMVKEDKKSKKEVIIHLRKNAKEYMQVGVKFNKLVAGRDIALHEGDGFSPGERVAAWMERSS